MENLVKAQLLNDIRELLSNSRLQVQSTVNSVMVQTYWQVGHLIVEDEQQGEIRAGYGKQVLKQLSKVLSAEFGRGFDSSNLRRMRSFYLAFPICGTVCHKLSWSHYRKLIAVENQEARQWYMNEAVA